MNMDKQHIIGLVQEAHGNAKDKGWWEEERTLAELVALIHSEASEALEDYRNGKEISKVWYEYKERDIIGKIDDAFSVIGVGPGGVVNSIQQSVTDGDFVILGKPCGIPSELADIVIRVFDLVGKYGIADPFASFLETNCTKNAEAVVHSEKSFGDNMGWLHVAISRLIVKETFYAAAEVVHNTYRLAGFYDIDLDAIIREKMAYNKLRPFRHGGKVL